jgi:hypothetical protein
MTEAYANHMLKLPLEQKGDVVLITLPPFKDHPELEDAFSFSSTGPFEFYSQISRTEPSVLELPVMVWKSILGRVVYSYNSRVALKVADAKGLKLNGHEGFRKFFKTFEMPQDKKAVFVLDGVEYEDVREMPIGLPIQGELGTFELSQPVMRVSDPCYEKGTWGAFTIEALPGQWRASVTLEDDDTGGYRVSRLTVVHESIEGAPDFSTFEAKPVGNAGVDSGQCGFYDDACYPEDKAQFEYDGPTFYGKICKALSSKYEYGESEYQADVIPGGFGAASHTFYGDGGYPCRVLRNAEGKVVSAYLWYAPKPDPFFPDADD